MRGHSRYLRLFPTLAALVALLLMLGGVTSAAVNVPFIDDVETLGHWVTDPPWERTTNDSVSPDHSWTDSPSAYYANDLDVSLTLASASAINLTTTTSPRLKFWHHYDLETGFDFGHVEVATSTNTGPWNRIASYSGTVTSPYAGPMPSAYAKSEGAVQATTDAFMSTPGEPWVLEQLSLADYAGEPTVWVRFRLVTDASVVTKCTQLPHCVSLSPST